MTKLCPRGKAAAKRKFKVYPSAYANMYASAVCSGKVTPGGKKKRIVRELKQTGGKVKMPKVGPKKERPKNLRDLKPVKPSQKGLRKLPKKVRNKMGYMKKGGRVGMGKAMRGGGCVR